MNRRKARMAGVGIRGKELKMYAFAICIGMGGAAKYVWIGHLLADVLNCGKSGQFSLQDS
jgi:hypothetical protein